MKSERRLAQIAVVVFALAGSVGCADAAAPDAVYTDPDDAYAGLATLVRERLELMADVAAYKWQHRQAVTDAAREARVLESAGRDASAVGLDGEAVAGFVAVNIEVARDMQIALHDRWRRDGYAFARRPRDLAGEIRPAIDALGSALLRALVLAESMLAEADAATFAAALSSVDPPAHPARIQQLATALRAVRRARAPDLDSVRALAMLRVGLPGDYAPFALVDARGTLEGADIELAKRIAATLGVELRFIRTSWPTLIADLESGRYDVALGGITVTAERAQHGGFSAAYHHGGKTIVARCADRARFDTLAELEHGARVIVNPGGTNERFVRTHLPAANVEVFADNTAIPAELLARRADAMITDDIEADLWSSRHPGLCRATQATFTADQKAALTVRDQALRSRIDEIMVPLVAAGVPARLLDVAIRQSH